MNFLKSLLEYVKSQWLLAQTLEEIQSENKSLRQENRELSDAMRDMAHQVHLALVTEKLEREKFMLQVENELLRRLPPKSD